MATKGDEVLSQFTQTVVEEEVEVRDEDKLRIGIIGTGWIAESHIESYKQHDGRRRSWPLADLIPGKAESVHAARYGVEDVQASIPTTRTMLDNEKLDARQRLHLQHRSTRACTIYALEHGVNVLLEKPMCVTTERGGGDHAVPKRRAARCSPSASSPVWTRTCR